VRELWTTRDRIARERDVTPSRLLPDSALVVAAQAMPANPAALLALSGFHGRGARPHLSEWFEALETARRLPEPELPPTARRQDGPPPPRAWADKDPVAAARLAHARDALRQLAEQLSLPVENLIAPDSVRRVMWQPPDDVPATLAELGARRWQVELVAPILATAITAAKAAGTQAAEGPGVAPPDSE
jgi:ribonuclease D